MKQIVAMGGGGFSMEPDNPLLDDFILGLTGWRRTTAPGFISPERSLSRRFHPCRWPKRTGSSVTETPRPKLRWERGF